MRTRIPGPAVSVTAFLAIVGLAGAATAAVPIPDRPRELTASKSLGTPWRGRLHRAAPMRDTRHLHFKWGSPGDERWGTEELVGLVTRSAAAVGEMRGGSLTVGDLSHRYGGTIPGHASHRSGRDVDLGFYYVDRVGRSVTPRRFYPVRPDGTAGRTLRFDAERSWWLVAALLTDPEVKVDRILVAEHVERRLLAEARRQWTPSWLYERARLRMFEPTNSSAHDTHFHVRIECPADDVECEG